MKYVTPKEHDRDFYFSQYTQAKMFALVTSVNNFAYIFALSGCDIVHLLSS